MVVHKYLEKGMNYIQQAFVEGTGLKVMGIIVKGELHSPSISTLASFIYVFINSSLFLSCFYSPLCQAQGLTKEK